MHIHRKKDYHQLSIDRAEIEDSGEYVVEAHNAHGDALAGATVLVLSKMEYQKFQFQSESGQRLEAPSMVERIAKEYDAESEIFENVDEIDLDSLETSSDTYYSAESWPLEPPLQIEEPLPNVCVQEGDSIYLCCKITGQIKHLLASH